MPCPICGTITEHNRICGTKRCHEFVHNCVTDPVFFFENALIIRYKKGRPQFFKLWDWQRDFLNYCKECLENGEPIRAIVQKGRRVGFSALLGGFHIWFTTCRAAYDGEDKYWDIISASHDQAKKLFRTGKRMIKWNPLLLNAVKVEANGVLRLGETKVVFVNGNETVEGIITALSSGGATKRGGDPTGQTFDEAAQIADNDYNDLDISSMAGDDHQIIGSTPYDDFGFFYDILNEQTEDNGGEFREFFVPTAELNEEGQKLLDAGEHTKITEDMITRTNGYQITAKKIVSRLRRYDLITAKREIFGQFVSGEELLYPSKLVKPVFDYERKTLDLVYTPENVSSVIKSMFPGTIAIYIGVDMAGKGHDKTVVTVFAIQSDNSAHMVYHESWSRMKYNNQYLEVQRIADCFNDNMWGAPRIFVDMTGTQDANRDSLEALGMDVTGVNFSIPTKANMAKILFTYLLRGRETDREFFSLMYDENMFRELLSVRADYKGEGGHLGDYVASIWCALYEMTDLSGGGEVDYDTGAPVSDAANVNSNI